MIIKAILILLFPTVLFPQSLTKERAERFALSLFYNSDSLSSMFSESTLKMSERLGIEYEGIKFKELISNDFDEDTKQLIVKDHENYTVQIDALEDGYSKLSIIVNGISKQYYFRDSLCISSLEYHCRNWMTRESEHFKFIISDESLFNQNNVESLEQFVNEIAARLELTDNDMNKLTKEKILYYLCRDEEEVRVLAGYEAKGMYNLAYDAILTTHNTHYHELIHLLVNLGLEKLPLYTHPMLQEGIAVALGGRGGMSRNILLRLGSYLLVTGLVDPSLVLSKKEFSEQNATLSYPAAGVMCNFIINRFGMDQFMILYRNHSGSADDECVSVIQTAELPDTTGWDEYLNSNLVSNDVGIDTLKSKGEIILNNELIKITYDDEKYFFQTSGNILITSGKQYPEFRSRKFYELLPNSQYKGEKYLIRANNDEVAVYDLYDNEAVAGFFGSLYYPAINIPKKGSDYIFSINRNIFDKPLQEMNIKVLHPRVQQK